MKWIIGYNLIYFKYINNCIIICIFLDLGVSFDIECNPNNIAFNIIYCWTKGMESSKTTAP